MSDPLEPVLKTLEEIEAETCSKGVAAFIQITQNDRELVVDADRAGLIHLAARLLSLAQQQSPGSHFHFDRVSITGSCDVPIIFCYVDTPNDFSSPPQPQTAQLSRAENLLRTSPHV